MNSNWYWTNSFVDNSDKLGKIQKNNCLKVLNQVTKSRLNVSRVNVCKEIKELSDFPNFLSFSSMGGSLSLHHRANENSARNQQAYWMRNQRRERRVTQDLESEGRIWEKSESQKGSPKCCI